MLERGAHRNIQETGALDVLVWVLFVTSRSSYIATDTKALCPPPCIGTVNKAFHSPLNYDVTKAVRSTSTGTVDEAFRSISTKTVDKT
eukprot:360935-Chlamydomonas_euryale.AAC.3